MVIVEKSFPRGGIPVSKDKSSDTRTETQIFGAVQKKIKKSKTKSSKNQTAESEDQNKSLETFSAETLSYETIQDGMVIMGVVKKVDQLFLNVALPGRIAARVSALEISESYTKAMKAFLQNTAQSEGYKSLKELFTEGQIVYGRVQELKAGKKGKVQIDLSLKPAQVHEDLNHSSVRKGFLFNGAVEEVQEHGYIIESGIKSLRCFVPLEKSQPGHVVGEMIFLKVEKITSDKSVSTCICKEVTASKTKVKDQSDPNLDYLLPSSIVKFQVSKHLKNGLKGSIMSETFSAYVNEHQLSGPLTTVEDYEINATYEARILYVMPLTKLVYLSLNLRTKDEDKTDDDDDAATKLKRGDVVEDAKVHQLGTGGVILWLNDRFKGVISYKTIKANYKGNYDQDELLTKYAKDSRHKVRIIGYDIMDCVYICTDDTATLNEKFFGLDDLIPGEFVTAEVQAHDHKVGGYALQVGKVKAVIEKLYLSPSAKLFDVNAKVKCRIIAVNQERKTAYLTNRPEYMSKNCNLVTNADEAKINGIYTGTVVKNTRNFALVKFFADIKGVIYNRALASGSIDHLEEGQTMQFRVAEKKDGQLILGLVENVFKLGEICPATIVNKLDSGLEIKVSYAAEEDTDNDLEFKGLIPIQLLSDYIDLLRAKLQMLQAGDEMQVVCVSGSIFSLRDVQYFLKHVTPNWKSVKPGDILKGYIKDVNDDVVDVILPINGYTKSVKIHLNMILMDSSSAAQFSVSKDQVIYVKVLSKVELTKTITISAKLTDVWDCQLSTIAGYVEQYLQEIKSIKSALKSHGNPLGRCKIGERVTAIFQCVNGTTKDWEYTLEKYQVTGIVKSWMVGKNPPKDGTKQECVIVWVDYSNNLVFISNKSADLEHISTDQNVPENLVGKGNINAKVLFKNESVFVCSLKKGKNPLVYCPVQLHANDFEKTASLKLSEGEFCKLTFIHATKPIAVLDDTHKIWAEYNRKRKLHAQQEVKAKKIKIEEISTNDNKDKPNKKDNEKQTERKRRVSESINVETKKSKQQTKDITEELEESETLLFYEDKTPDKKAASKVVNIEALAKTPENTTTKITPHIKSLAGISDFWTTDLSNINKKDDSSEDEDEENDNGNTGDVKQKKKLTAAEKFKQQREEEARLRAIEEKYADPKQLPDTVDQFDRLVLSEPNNSKHWINYMVFHLQSTEIDKARAVARRALKTITFRNTDDQINIWVALLNLELRYGSKENFNDTLKEALMYNEPLKIYLRAVEIITDAQKTQDLIEMIGVITKKFKTEQEMWKVAANGLFTINMAARAQQLLHKALACLPERDHVNTIVMFANLNHKHGQNEMAQTLLDQVVTSYPKRVDVWCQYVDMLTKEDLIDSARNVLERAVIQKIPLRKMRTLFKKYLEFEERFGSDANVQRVKQLALDFVKKNENL